MKKLVKESIEFKRNQEITKGLGVGMSPEDWFNYMEDILNKIDPNIKCERKEVKWNDGSISKSIFYPYDSPFGISLEYYFDENYWKDSWSGKKFDDPKKMLLNAFKQIITKSNDSISHYQTKINAEISKKEKVEKVLNEIS